MDILIWQLVIGGGVVLVSLLFGRNALALAVVAAVIWTVVMIFTNWLMLLQFATIGLAAALAAKMLSSPRYPVFKKRAWVFVISIIALFLAACLVNWWMNESDRQATEEYERIHPKTATSVTGSDFGLASPPITPTPPSVTDSPPPQPMTSSESARSPTDIFHCRDDNGRTLFQNFPCPGNEYVHPAPDPKRNTVNRAALEPAKANYANNKDDAVNHGELIKACEAVYGFERRNQCGG